MQVSKKELRNFVDNIRTTFDIQIPDCWEQHPNVIQQLAGLFLARQTVEITSDGFSLLDWLERFFNAKLRIDSWLGDCRRGHTDNDDIKELNHDDNFDLSLTKVPVSHVMTDEEYARDYSDDGEIVDIGDFDPEDFFVDPSAY